MRQLLLLLTFICTSISVVHGQEESVLWKISGKGLKRDSYLLGTAHTVSYKLIDSFPKLKSIFRECEFGIFEKSPNSIGDVKYVDIHTPPLDSVFTPSEYALIDSFFSNSPFGSIKPYNNDASLSGMLQAVVMLKREGTKNQEMFFDEYIQFFFIDTLKKKTYGLDEPEEMARSSARENHRQTAESIVYLIKNDVDVDQGLKPLFDISLYRTSLKSDMKLNKQLGDSEGEQVIRDFTIERHRIWLPKIITKVNEGPCFIAVGLGHLQYNTGLIQLLRQEGYTLKPVKLKKYSL
ncbi:MAG: TraB/GumN family protein [Flavisolibacter sp.]|nr:TraB/GumN family protein [Flavisolibacter sp.]